MYKFTWSNDKISLVLKSSKELLNTNKNEAQNDYAILKKNIKFVKYLRGNIEGTETKEEALLKAKLNNILDDQNQDVGVPEYPRFFDIVKWLPEFTISEFRKTVESCCLMIENLTKDLSPKDHGLYKRWKTRSDTHYDANAVRASDEIVKISTDRWGLVFKNNLYIVNHTSLSSGDTIFLCITFKTLSDEEQIVISDYTDECPKWRGISVSSKFLKIVGADNHNGYIQIPYTTTKNKWFTVLVIWGGFEQGHDSLYKINDGITGSFRANPPEFLLSNETSLGDINNKEMSKPLNGCISNIDLFQTEFSIPDQLQHLIINSNNIKPYVL